MKLRAAIFIGLVVLAVIPYLGIWDHEFVFDDKVVIAQNPFVKEFDWGGIFESPYWFNIPSAGLYRPLTTLGFAIDWALGNGSPRPFLVTNVILHAIATLLAYLLLRRLFPQREEVAWGAAALFAVHPLHVEAVAGIVGRTDLLSAVLLLGCYLAWLRAENTPSPSWRIVSPLLWLGALLAKENGIMLPLLLFFHRRGWIAGAPRGRLRWRDLTWIGALFVAAVLRFNALGGFHRAVIDPVANPLVRVGALSRAMGAGGVLARQLLQTLTGAGLSADYSYAAIRPSPSLYVPGIFALAAVAALSGIVFRKARQSVEAWGIAFFLSFWLVTSNLVIPIGTAQADRFFYLPLLGLLAVAVSQLRRFAPLLARLIPRIPPRWPIWGFLALLVAAGATRSILRADDWKDERALYESALKTEPMSVNARWNLSVVLLSEEGERSAARALAILEPVARWAPDHASTLFRQAVAFMFLDQNAQADSLFHAALQAGTPDSVDAHIELGNLALQREDGETALAEFDAAGRMNELPEHVAIGRASALSILGRYRESAAAWGPILARHPDSVSVRVACAYTLRKSGEPQAAIVVLEAGLPRGQDPRVIDGLAEAYLAADRIEDARKLRALVTDPDLARRIDQDPRARGR